MNGVAARTPKHVPLERIFDFDLYFGAEVTECPHEDLAAALQNQQDIVYTPRNGGHWVVTRQKTAIELLQNSEVFSSDPHNTSAGLIHTAIRRIPLDLDPPIHGAYRKILNGMFSPSATKAWAAMVRSHAQHLIDSVAYRGQCEFLSEISERYPPEIFLRLLGIPVARRPTFMRWIDEMSRAADPEVSRRASAEVGKLMAGEIIERRRNSGGEDLISRLVNTDFEGRSFSDEELVGIAVLLFIGGLDTVVALLSFIMLFLAEHEDQRRRLVEAPEMIPDALEEIIRRFSIASIFRYVAKDATVSGVDFRAGDRVVFMHQIYGADDHEVVDPFTVDFDRPVSRHTAFGAGPHRCLGSHLARMEMCIFVEEWLRRIPDFKVVDRPSLRFRGGKVILPLTVPLSWPSQRSEGGAP